jgi:hypothetical protein
MEELLILTRPEAHEVRRNIESKARVVQEGSDKVLVVEGSPDAVRAAAGLPGVATIDSLAPDALDKLSPGEQVFVDAWRQRQTAGPKKERIGDGLNWGTEGFKAP